MAGRGYNRTSDSPNIYRLPVPGDVVSLIDGYGRAHADLAMRIGPMSVTSRDDVTTLANNQTIQTERYRGRFTRIVSFRILSSAGIRVVQDTPLDIPIYVSAGDTISFKPGSLSMIMTTAQFLTLEQSSHGMVASGTYQNMRDETKKMVELIENNHTTLAEFQRKHGLVPDGIAGPKTEAVRQRLAYEKYKRDGGAPITPPSFAHAQTQTRCPATATLTTRRGMKFSCQCDRQENHGATDHSASHAGTVMRWPFSLQHVAFGYNKFDVLQRVPSLSETAAKLEMQYQLDLAKAEADKAEVRMAKNAADRKAAHRRLDEIHRAEMAARRNALQEQEDKLRPAKGITKESYARRHAALNYRLRPAVWAFGWIVTVSAAVGKYDMSYWRPFRVMAVRTGERGVRRQAQVLTRLFKASNPEIVTSRDLKILHEMSSEDLTEQLRREEDSERKKALAEWDKEFGK